MIKYWMLNIHHGDCLFILRTDPAGQPAPKPRKLPLVIVKNVQTFRPEDTPDEFLQAIMKELGQQE